MNRFELGILSKFGLNDLANQPIETVVGGDLSEEEGFDPNGAISSQTANLPAIDDPGSLEIQGRTYYRIGRPNDPDAELDF